MLIITRGVVLDTTKVQIFKQITTQNLQIHFQRALFQIPQRYRFSSKSQQSEGQSKCFVVVLDTTKVQIFKQITTQYDNYYTACMLFQISQRYRFSSKSQHIALSLQIITCCFRYHKGTDFQANHNYSLVDIMDCSVVLDTTKVQIFKQITTRGCQGGKIIRCFRYHKGTDFQANHNRNKREKQDVQVVLDTTKVQIFKQITTDRIFLNATNCCFRYHKGTDFQANHNVKLQYLF